MINDGEPLDKDEFIKRLNQQSNSYRNSWLQEQQRANTLVTKIKDHIQTLTLAPDDGFLLQNEIDWLKELVK